MNKIITFEKEAKEEILHFFGKAVDKEGYIVDQKSGEKIPAPDGEPLELKDFAGIKRGSLIFVKSDINSIIELVDAMKQHANT